MACCKDQTFMKLTKIILWCGFGLTCGAIILSSFVVDFFSDGPFSKVIVPRLETILPSRLDDPDFRKSAETFARDQGYSFETHHVETEDGYFIEMHRIYNPRFPTRGPPVVVALGIFMVSTASLFERDNHTNAYLFASEGFDVWLMNSRGCTFGLKHRYLDPERNRSKFFDFSLLEIGQFDYAAQIDYVISATGFKQVFVAVVSQSVASMLALLAKRPLYNAKIRAMVSFGGLRGGCFSYSKTADIIQFMVWPSDLIVWSESFGPFMTSMPDSMKFLCARTGDFCAHLVMAASFSQHGTYLNKTRFPIYLEHVPGGTSFRNLIYLAQTRQSDCDGSVRDFDFDHGPFTKILISLGLLDSKNRKIYGSQKPPLLNPKNIRVPLKLYYSISDNLSTEKENFKIANDIGIPPWDIHRMDDEEFEHINYIFNVAKHEHVFHAIDFFKSFKLVAKT